jgi:hypothetical protein
MQKKHDVENQASASKIYAKKHVVENQASASKIYAKKHVVKNQESVWILSEKGTRGISENIGKFAGSFAGIIETSNWKQREKEEEEEEEEEKKERKKEELRRLCGLCPDAPVSALDPAMNARR